MATASVVSPHAFSSSHSESPALPARKPVPKPHGHSPSTAHAPAPTHQPPLQDNPPLYSEAPPSYEDAVALDLAPVDGLRRDYAPPTSAEDPLFSRDAKV